MFIRKILLEDFKSHPKLEINPSKFTIFIGPNGSGKSSVIQSLKILKNSLSKEGAPRGFRVSDGALELGDIKDIIRFRKEKSIIHLSGSKYVQGLKSDSQVVANFAYRIEFGFDGPLRIFFSVGIEDYEITFDWNKERPIRCSIKDKSNNSVVQTTNANVSDGIVPRFGVATPLNAEMQRKFHNLFQNGDFVNELLNEFFYIPFYRAGTTYAYQLLSTNDDVLKYNSDHIISALITSLSKDTQLLDKVSEFMRQLTGKTIRPRILDSPSGDHQITIEFVKNGFATALSNEGTGPNQAILLLYILASTPNNSVIAIDEPEIHLHPKAQTRLAKIMMEIAKKQSKQIIFTTHSEHMLYPFLASVASKNKNSLKKEELRVYYFDQDPENLVSTCEDLSVNEHGQLKEGLKGFWEADSEMFQEFYGEDND